MALFAWLFGKKDKVEIGEYRIWLTQQAKNAGIWQEIAQALADTVAPRAVIVVAHFQDCLEQMQAVVAGLDADRVFVTSASDLARRSWSDMATDKSCSILIVVGERHPLQSHDDAILDFAQNLFCRSRIVYHLSLEDPLVKRFAGDWVERVLRGLGMKEDEPIESRLVARRIRSVSREIAGKAVGDTPANSAEEWLEKNCPS